MKTLYSYHINLIIDLVECFFFFFSGVINKNLEIRVGLCCHSGMTEAPLHALVHGEHRFS